MVSHVEQCKGHCECLERGNVPLHKVLKRSRLKALAACYHTGRALEMDCAFSLRYFSRHGIAVHRYRNKHCHRTPVTAWINSMDMDTTDLSAEAGLDESGMAHSTTDTAG